MIMEYNKHQKGAAAELKAQAWLIEQGYEVFRNVAQWGPSDLVIYKSHESREGVFTRVDVKTLSENGDKDDWHFLAARYLTKEQISSGVRVLFVLDNFVGWNRDYFPSYKDYNKNNDAIQVPVQTAELQRTSNGGN